MKHIRSHIRNAIYDILVAHNDLQGVEIFKNRTKPIGLQGDGSALEVIVTREASQPQGNHSDTIEYSRTIDVQIIGYVVGAAQDEVADKSDGLALIVEQALHTDLTLVDLALEGWLEATDMVLDSNAYANASFAQSWKYISALSQAQISEL